MAVVNDGASNAEAVVTKKRKPGYKPTLAEIGVPGVLAQRVSANGDRRIVLTKKERGLLKRRELLEGAVALFLDLEQGHSYAEIAADLGITTRQLGEMTRSREFMELYDQNFSELGHDPRFRATQQSLADLLPHAIRELKSLLLNSPPQVRLSAIKEIIRLNGIQEPKNAGSDGEEVRKFLSEAKINIAVLPAAPALPDGFQRNIEAYTEGNFKEIDSHQQAIHGDE